MDEASIKASVNIVWNYTKMSAKLEPADAIIAMGSMDMRVAERAADLWRQKLAPVIVVTGSLGRLTGDDVTVSEAAKFAAVLRACDIPDDAVLIEDKASNGAENFTFSVAMLHENGNPATKVIAVTQPYMERRAYATGKKLFPEMGIQMTSPEVPYEDYPTADVSKELMLNIMVGEVYRIQNYPAKGFTIAQDVPEAVLSAAHNLAKMGFNEQLPK